MARAILHALQGLGRVQSKLPPVTPPSTGAAQDSATHSDSCPTLTYKDDMKHQSDFLVIGSGLAGLSFALKVADQGKVIILAKSKSTLANTAMAQGGIAAVMAPDDSFEEHIRDTLVAGAGLCHKDVVLKVVQEAPARIDDLINWGVKFDLDDGQGGKVHLTREGGHSHRRILHVQDHTGQEIHAALLEKVLRHPNIEIHEEKIAIDLILDQDCDSHKGPFHVGQPRCLGVSVLDKALGKQTQYYARFTMLATGGAGKVYLYTSNWSGASGDGIAMAYRAGARIANLEFMQFHPTCMYHPNAGNFLISEAVRGEGGELLNAEGVAFMKKYHPLGSLAPRDIVARSIDAEMKRTAANCVFLDISKKPAEFIKAHFPVIYHRCLEYGVDMTKEPIPVVPAAHYLCGGIVTDLNACSDIAGLLVAGESACTGLHGANRLASNSLLECLVFSHRAAEFAKKNFSLFPIPEVSEDSTVATEQGSLEQNLEVSPAQAQNDDELVVIKHMWEEIRRLMWNYVGIVRSNRRLERAAKRLENILAEIDDYYGHYQLHPDIIELRNIAMVADLSVKCALHRKESRGIHYNLDYPFAAKPIDLSQSTTEAGYPTVDIQQNRSTLASSDTPQDTILGGRR